MQSIRLSLLIPFALITAGGNFEVCYFLKQLLNVLLLIKGDKNRLLRRVVIDGVCWHIRKVKVLNALQKIAAPTGQFH